MDIISILLLLFVILVIIICISVDLFRVNKDNPLPFNYRLRRLFNWSLLAISYASMYIGRYNFTLLSHLKIKNSIHLSDSGYGWILTFGYWFYAFVSPFMGSIGDLKGPKKVVVIGVIGSGVVNCLLGLILIPKDDKSILHSIPPVALFSLFNGLNFMLQSLATGSINKINSGWYRASERGVFGGIFSAILATSFFFTFNIGDLLVDSSIPWNFIFILPGIMLIISGCISIFVVKENPKQSGFENIDLSEKTLLIDKDDIENNEINQNNNNDNNIIISSIELNEIDDENNNNIIITNEINQDGADEIHDDQNQLGSNSPMIKSIDDNNNTSSSLKDLFLNVIREVLKKENLKPIASRENIINALSLFCIGWVKEGFVSWFSLFLSNRYGDNSNETLISISLSGVSIGSMTGGFICGWISDYFFKSKRSPSLFIFFLLLNILSIILFFITSQAISTFILIVLFILIFGINNVLAVTALLDLGTVRNAALMAGLLTMFQYIASGFSGFLLGYIVENLGFGYWLLSMLPFSIAGLLMMAWNSNYLKGFTGIFKSISKITNQNVFNNNSSRIELK